MCIGLLRDAAPSGRSGQKADLHQVWLIHILQRHRLLAYGGRQRVQTYRAAAIFFNNGLQQPSIYVVKTQLVYLQRQQRLVRYGLGDNAVGHHLGEVPYPPQHPVGDTGRAP